MEMFPVVGFLILLSFTLSTTPAHPHSHTSRNSSFSDQQSLLAFKSSLLLDPNNSLSNWTPNLTFCSWTGVTCSSPRHGVRVSSLNVTGGKVSTKGDVYSYEILLLELLTRRRPIDNIFVEGLNLPKWASTAFPNRLREVVDNILFRDVNEIEVSRVWQCLTQLMQVGLACTNELPQQRPSMMEIVQKLENISFIFLGTQRKYQFPMDTSSLLGSTTGGDNTMLGSDQRSFSSTF